MEKMREEFEAFYESYMLGEGRRIEYIKNEIQSFKPERNKYGCSDAQEFWVVWKASRAALCTELRKWVCNKHDNETMSVVDVIELIEISVVESK